MDNSKISSIFGELDKDIGNDTTQKLRHIEEQLAKHNQAINRLIRNAESSKNKNPRIAVVNARTSAEAICKAVFMHEFKAKPGKIMLDGYINRLAKQEFLPRNIVAALNTVREHGNLVLHDATYDPDENFLGATLNSLSSIQTWYFDKYPIPKKKPEIVEPKEKNEKPGHPLKWIACIVALLLGLSITYLIYGGKNKPDPSMGEEFHQYWQEQAPQLSRLRDFAALTGGKKLAPDAWRKADAMADDAENYYKSLTEGQDGRANDFQDALTALKQKTTMAGQLLERAGLIAGGMQLDNPDAELESLQRAFAGLRILLTEKPNHTQGLAMAEHYSEKLKVSNSLGMGFVYLPPGEFLMGSRSEETGRNEDENQVYRQVNGFYLAQHEVTVAQFKSFVEDLQFKKEVYRTDAEKRGKCWARVESENPWGWVDGISWKNVNFFQDGGHPVTCITHNDAIAFCKWLTKKEGRNYRLPLESEWEYACRAGTTSPFSFGGSLSSDMANIYGLKGYPNTNQMISTGRFRKGSTPVGLFAPNAWGLYDMHGNVWEWCQDPYIYDYKVISAETEDNAGIAWESEHVRRGGGWASSPMASRSANRWKLPPDYPRTDSGFRIVLQQE